MAINTATRLKIAAVAVLVGTVLASIPTAQAQRDRRITLENDSGFEIGSGRVRQDGRVAIDLDSGGELTGRIRNGRMVLEDERGREYEFRCQRNGRCERD